MRELDRPDIFQIRDVVVAVAASLFLAILDFVGKSLLMTAFLDLLSLQEINVRSNMQTQVNFIISAADVRL